MKHAILVGALVIASTAAQAQDEIVGPALRVVSTVEGEPSGTTSQTRIEQLVQPGHARLVECFQGRLGETWFVRLSLANGRVDSASAELEGTRHRRVSRCVANALRGLSMPAGIGASIVVRMEITCAGVGGLGARGTGPGGGGTGSTGIGRGGGTGTGSGTGMGGRLGMSGMQNQPRVRTGRAIVRGSLSREVIRRVIRSHINEVRYCYERELVNTPGLAGTVRARFVISPRGQVQSVDVSNTEGNLGNVPGCIARQVRRWRFPEPAGGGIVVVTYPFVLAPSQ